MYGEHPRRDKERIGSFQALLAYSAAAREPPLEVVSKVILRQQDLKTTQMHPGRIREVETLRWMDVLHGSNGNHALASSTRVSTS